MISCYKIRKITDDFRLYVYVDIFKCLGSRHFNLSPDWERFKLYTHIVYKS